MQARAAFLGPSGKRNPTERQVIMWDYLAEAFMRYIEGGGSAMAPKHSQFIFCIGDRVVSVPNIV